MNRSRVQGAAENVDLRGPREPSPFERDTDEGRIIVCECLTCGVSETVFAEAGRARRWEHDEQHASHVVDCWRIDDSGTEETR